MFYDKIVITLTESYILMFMCIYTITHIFHTRIIKPPIKLKEGVSYDLEFVFKNSEADIITGSAFFVMFFNIIALPITALSSSHYWIYISLSTTLIIILFLSDYSFATRRNSSNDGLIMYAAIPMYYFPALCISIVLYLFDIGTS